MPSVVFICAYIQLVSVYLYRLSTHLDHLSMSTDEDDSNRTTSPFPFSQYELTIDKPPRTPKHQTGAKSRTNPRPNNTPLVRTTNSTRDLFLDQDAEARQERFDSEFRKWCVGPMPIEMFLQEFLPSGETEQHFGNQGNEFRSVPIPGSKDNETVMYKPLVPPNHAATWIQNS